MKDPQLCENLYAHREDTTMAEPGRISVSLALQSLTDAVADVERNRAALSRSVGERDDLIRDALSHVPKSKLVKITGLTRERIYAIENQPPWKAGA